MSDGGHVILKCSNCNKELVDIWIVRPEEDLTTDLVAVCCYCKDKSFKTTIQGGYYLAGIHRVMNEENLDDIPVTVLHNIDYNDNLVTIDTRRYNES